MLIMVANSCPNGRTGTGGAGYHEEFGQPAPAGANRQDIEQMVCSETIFYKLAKLQ
jgi:hypothetical protein